LCNGFLKCHQLQNGFYLFIYLTTGILSEYLPLSAADNYFMLNSNNMSTCVTSVFYFGHLFSLSYLYELLLFLSYSKSLEYEYLSLNRRKNYLFCLLIGLILILILSLIKPFQVYFPSQSFVFYIIYLYNNCKNPNGTTVFHPALFIDNKYMTIFLIFISAFFHMFRWSEYFVGIAAAYLFITLEQMGFIEAIQDYF